MYTYICTVGVKKSTRIFKTNCAIEILHSVSMSVRLYKSLGFFYCVGQFYSQNGAKNDEGMLSRT